MATMHPGPLRAPIWLRWAETPRRAIGVAACVSLGLVAVVLALNGIAGLGWQAATRLTARLSFPLWLLGFVAGPLHRLAPGATTRALLRRRRAIGLAFATTHAIHGLAILCLASFEPEALAPELDTIAGGLGYVVIAAMAATSSDRAVRALGGRRWRALHRTGQWTLFVIFLATYGGRVAEGRPFWPALGLLLAALALRSAAAAQSLRLRSSTLPTE